MRSFDAVVVGAGPAGMSAAIGLRAHGLSVLVVDEQPAPGGQIWRAVEAVAPTTTGALLGRSTLPEPSSPRVFDPVVRAMSLRPGFGRSSPN